MQVVYNKVGVVVEEFILLVWIVYLFVGEIKVVLLYFNFLDEIVKLGIKQGLVKGFVMGFVGINFVIWVFVGWYGSEQVLVGWVDGGNILMIGIVIILGGLQVFL